MSKYPNFFDKTTKKEDLQEHSLEMQFPLIKYFCPDAKIVTIRVGDLTHKEQMKLGEILRTTLK
jgi:AmmeMemoRadiSam system protein B